MGGADVGAAIGRPADDDGTVDLATAHIAHAGGVVDHLVPGDIGETPEHEFHDGPHAEHGSADAHADETGFGNRGIHHTLVAPLFPQALGDFVGSIILSDFFAHQDNVFIAGQFFIEGLIDGVAVGDQRHVEKGAEVGKSKVSDGYKTPGRRGRSGTIAENRDLKTENFSSFYASPRSATSSSSSPR